MTPRECAQQALDLIRQPEHWTKGAHARTQPNGPSVSPIAAEAKCWCGEGAIAKIAGHDPQTDDEGKAYDLYIKTIHLVRKHGALHEEAISLSWVNDKQGHAELVAVFNRALSATA